MAWVRGGDPSATYPAVMLTAVLPGADERTVNEVMGFIVRLAFLSAAHTTDYVVDAGTVALMGGSRTAELIKLCKRAKLLTEVRVDRLPAYKIIDDPDFLHLRLRAELEWEAQQQSDAKNEKLTVPVRLRDGDRCRYCNSMVVWRGRPSNKTATFDHVRPGKAATLKTLVVACRGCNSGLRDVFGREHERLLPEPAEPYYSEFTAAWLTDRAQPTAPTKQPDSQSDTGATNKIRKRPGSQPGTARSASDPANAGHRAQPKPPRQRPGSQPGTARSASDPTNAGHRAPAAEEKSDFGGISQAIESSSTGSGRVGSGSSSVTPHSPETSARTRRRRRSARGRGDPDARS